MITLKSFGTIDLHGDDNRPLQAILAQPKRLAILAYLAIATPRGYHRRDKLLALFWPELDETRARQALNRAIHYIRSALGENVLLSRGPEELGLDPARLWSDAAGFEDAIDRGELAEALALYRGPLLPGFFLDETPEFDRWLETARALLHQRAVDATRLLSEREEAGGHLVPAIELTRRWMALAPQDESAVRRLMTLVERGGDRAGAIHIYEEFARGLSADLDIEPGAETRALYETIRDRNTPLTTTGVAANSVVVPAMAIQAAPYPTIAPQATPPTTRRLSRGALAAIAATATVAVLWAATSRRPSASPAESTMAVMPFSASAGSTRAAADSVHDRLVQLLDTMKDVRAIGTRDRAKSRFAVVGNIKTTDNLVTIEARLYDSTAGPDPIALTAVEGVQGETARMASDLAWQLSFVIGAGTRSLDPSGARELKPSAAGIEEMKLGRTAHAAGRFDEAIKHFQRVIATDTGYVQGYLALSRAAQWEDQWDLALWAADMAMKRLDRFQPLDRLSVRGWDAYLHARPIEAERLLRTVLANWPVDGDARYSLGEVQFHWGPGLGWPLSDSRRTFTQLDIAGGLALGPLIHLARIAAMEGDHGLVDSLVKRGLNSAPDAAQALELRALRAFAGSGRRSEQEFVLSALAKAGDQQLQSIATLAAVCGLEGDQAWRAVELMRRPARPPFIRASGDVLDLLLRVAHGNPTRGSENLTPARTAEFRAVFATLPFVEATPDTLRVIFDALQRYHPGTTGWSLHAPNGDPMPYQRLYLLALLSFRRGNVAAARAYADSLEQAPMRDRTDRELRIALARNIRATILRAAHKPAEALAILGEPKSSPDFVVPGLLRYDIAAERFLRAELLRELHRDDEALRWYETFPDFGGYDLPYAAPVLLRRAEINARRGDSTNALALRARANAIWPGSVRTLK